MSKRIRSSRDHHRDQVRKYGLSMADYGRMLREQDGLCAICRNRPAHRLHVDHSHASGKVRGLLCCHCNKGLSGARDSVLILERMIAYLARYA